MLGCRSLALACSREPWALCSTECLAVLSQATCSVLWLSQFSESQFCLCHRKGDTEQNKNKTNTHTKKTKTTKEKRPGAVRERLCRNHGATACKLQSCQCWGDWRQTLERASVFKQCWLGAEDTVFKYASPCVLGAVYSHLEPEPRSSKRAATCFCCLFSLNTPECMSCGYKWRIDFFFPLLFWIFS